VSFDELCRQLAFHSSGDSGRFDVIILAYSLLTYWETSEDVWLSTFARGVVTPPIMKIVEKSLKILFDSQAKDGTWRKGEPINIRATNSADMASDTTSRDIGNSYVFFFDLLEALTSAMGSSHPELLAPYLPNFERYVTEQTWLLYRERVLVTSYSHI
jgi:hypothetical protein